MSYKAADFDKNKLIKDVKHHFLHHYPESMSKLTKRVMAEMTIFTDGFVSCLLLMGEEPMRKEDVYDLLLTKSIEWVKIQLKLD